MPTRAELLAAVVAAQAAADAAQTALVAADAALGRQMEATAAAEGPWLPPPGRRPRRRPLMTTRR